MLKWILAFLLLIANFSASTAFAENYLTDNEKETIINYVMQNNHFFATPYDTHFWLFDMSNRLRPFIKTERERWVLLAYILDKANETNIQPELILATIEVESTFRTYAFSSASASGLMQVRPFWRQLIGERSDDLFNWETNINYGCHILRHYLNMEHGDVARALERYNGSLGREDYIIRILRAEKHWY